MIEAFLQTAIGIMHEGTGLLLSKTVQAPQKPLSQPFFAEKIAFPRRIALNAVSGFVSTTIFSLFRVKGIFICQ